MERQTEGEEPFLAFAQKLIGQRIVERRIREGKLEGMRRMSLRLLERAGIALTEEDRAQIQACTDAEALDRWVDNALGRSPPTRCPADASVRACKVNVDVPADHEIVIRLPDDFPPGPAEVIVLAALPRARPT